MPKTTPMLRVAGPLLAAVALAACSSSGPKMPKVGKPDIAPSDVANAASQPVRDLNLMGDEPGDYLVTVVNDPYSVPPPDCSALNGEIARLDEILGADVDAPRKSDDDMVGAITLAAVRNVTRLPFRGVIREVTGAAPKERAMRQALLAGAVRRAYLKGMRVTLKCTVAEPEGPARPPMPPPTVD